MDMTATIDRVCHFYYQYHKYLCVDAARRVEAKT